MTTDKDAGLDLTRAEFERACSLLPPDFTWGLPVTPRLVLEVANDLAPTPSAQEEVVRLPIDVQAMLETCVPGGNICDPQSVADSIRAWFVERAEAVPPMPSNASHVTRRIRRCESEAAAQLVLEQFAMEYARAALAAASAGDQA
jgi:hypothetical protein